MVNQSFARTRVWTIATSLRCPYESRRRGVCVCEMIEVATLTLFTHCQHILLSSTYSIFKTDFDESFTLYMFINFIKIRKRNTEKCQQRTYNVIIHHFWQESQQRQPDVSIIKNSGADITESTVSNDE